MARQKKQPNELKHGPSAWSYEQSLAWLREEYKLLATRRNTLAFLYNQQKDMLGIAGTETEEMKGWRVEIWHMEYTLRWIRERVEAGAYNSMKQMVLDV